MKCDLCGCEFHPAPGADEVARAEFAINYPGLPFDPNELAVLCDDCYYQRALPHLRGLNFFASGGGLN